MHRDDAPVVIQAPAKLNLFLEILARRSDGFHEIETLMTAIDLFDTVTVIPSSGNELRVNCEWASGLAARAGADIASRLGALPHQRDNLVFRALQLLRDRAGIDCGATANIIKRIPAAAGLGGASSDAAAALMAANKAWRLHWSRAQLAQLAAELGSDVPFFLTARAAICRGRGEQIAPLALRSHLHFVVVRPPGGLSTAQVYSACQPAQAPHRVERIRCALVRGDVSDATSAMTNRLQAAAQSLSPWIETTRRAFEGLDCLGHQMSGSGTSYFGVCRNRRHARRVEGALRSRGFDCAFCAQTIATQTAA